LKNCDRSSVFIVWPVKDATACLLSSLPRGVTPLTLYVALIAAGVMLTGVRQSPVQSRVRVRVRVRARGG
jgi:hypothetical protein